MFISVGDAVLTVYKLLYEKLKNQEGIASKFNVTQKTVSTWSNGAYPSRKNAEKIACFLGVTPGEVFDGWRKK